MCLFNNSLYISRSELTVEPYHIVLIMEGPMLCTFMRKANWETVARMPVDTSTLLRYSVGKLHRHTLFHIYKKRPNFREIMDGLGIGNGMSGTLETLWLHQTKQVPKSTKETGTV